jgi:hypothetical protein
MTSRNDDRRIGCDKVHPDADVYHPEGHPVSAMSDVSREVRMARLVAVAYACRDMRDDLGRRFEGYVLAMPHLMNVRSVDLLAILEALVALDEAES